MKTTSQTPDIHRSAWPTAGIWGNVAAPKRDPGSFHHPPVNSQPVPVGAAAQWLQGWATLPFPRCRRGVCSRPSSGLNSACCEEAAERRGLVPQTVKLKSHQADALRNNLQFPFSGEQGSQILYYHSSSKPHGIYFLLHSVYIICMNH